MCLQLAAHIVFCVYLDQIGQLLLRLAGLDMVDLGGGCDECCHVDWLDL